MTSVGPIQAADARSLPSRFRAPAPELRDVMAAFGICMTSAVLCLLVGLSWGLLWMVGILTWKHGGDWVLRRLQPRLAAANTRRVQILSALVGGALSGAPALLVALQGAAWGVAVGALLLTAPMIFASRVLGHSKIELTAFTAPLCACLLLLPIVAWAHGAPLTIAASLAIAGGAVVVASRALHKVQLESIERERQARTVAEAATDAKSAFIAMVSHELRTPLSAIMAGASELSKLEQDQRGQSALIADAARMMRALLNDLLDHSKIEAGQMTVETITFDLRDLVGRTMGFWNTEARKRGLRMRLEGAHALPRWVTGDPTRLRQVLNNLMSNALKFTTDGSITLRCRAQAGRLAFLVIDTGPGLSSDQIARLFRPFEQANASTARTHGGTGLGLSISLRLAQLMGGDLTVQSRPDNGAAFALEIPLIVAAAPADLLETPGASPGFRVLIVDDHAVNRQAFTLYMDPLSEQIVTAQNGLEALECLRRQDFDLVLMDLNMPGLGGLETVQRLRASDGPNQTTPVIALTGSTSLAESSACRAAGMNGFVPKPVEVHELWRAVEAVLAEREARPTPRAPV